jgi:hypothetical protein
MRTLSRYVTLTPLGKIVDEELAKELNRRFGRPAFPIKVPKFGIGVRFAFGDPKRFTLTGFTEQQRPMVEAGLGCSIEQYEAQANAALEYSVLTTPSVMRAQVSGFDPYSARRVADQQLASFNVLINTLRTDPDVSTRPLDAICARLLGGDILDNYTRALLSAGYTEGSPLRTKEALTEFLMRLPSQRVAAMIQYHYLRDVKRDWTINDLRDIDALSMAIPYCDIVVTDKKACDAAVNRAQLDREFNTKIFCRLADLAAHLEARAAA